MLASGGSRGWSEAARMSGVHEQGGVDQGAERVWSRMIGRVCWLRQSTVGFRDLWGCRETWVDKGRQGSTCWVEGGVPKCNGIACHSWVRASIDVQHSCLGSGNTKPLF